jgi:hypothetical protein
MDGLSSSILPPIDAPASVFFAGKPGYTIRMPEKIAWSRAHPAALDC